MGMAAALLLLAGCGRSEETSTEPADTPPEVTEAPEDTGAVWTLTQHADTSGLQCMFYTLHNEEDGYLIVIDGGNPENEAHVRDVIRENGGVVNAWFVTHFHGDHASVFNAVYAAPGDISIENVYTTNLDRDIFYSVAHEWDTPETFDKFCELAENAPDIKRLHADDELDLDGLRSRSSMPGTRGERSCTAMTSPTTAPL
jgi:glyoxylase-like metal-dependent hydrolase (beta-lactamase superfamily II)